MPMLDLAMPYEAPKEVRVMAAAQPMAPKKDCESWSQHCRSLWGRELDCDLGRSRRG